MLDPECQQSCHRTASVIQDAQDQRDVISTSKARKKNRINGSSIVNYKKIKLKLLKRTLKKKRKEKKVFYWMKLKPHLLHHVTAVKAAFHCPSPRGSACVQAAPGGKIQTRLRSQNI